MCAMTDPNFGIQTVLTLAVVAIALAAIFFIVRGAILSALAEDRRRLERAAARAQTTP